MRFRFAARFSCPLALASVLLASVTARQGPTALPPPIDPQRVQDQQDMTWADYKPIPGHNWANPSIEGTRKLRVALVAIDFRISPS